MLFATEYQNNIGSQNKFFELKNEWLSKNISIIYSYRPLLRNIFQLNKIMLQLKPFSLHTCIALGTSTVNRLILYLHISVLKGVILFYSTTIYAIYTPSISLSKAGVSN